MRGKAPGQIDWLGIVVLMPHDPELHCKDWGGGALELWVPY